MNFAQLQDVLSGRPFWFSSLHDYTLKDGFISGLGIFEESLEYLKMLVGEEWEFIEKRRNPDNDFLRIDIVERKR